MNTIITSKLLSLHSEIIHGVSTKAGGTAPFYNNMSKHVGDKPERVMQNRAVFYSAIGAAGENFAHANQVHSANAESITSPGLYKETDALITNTKGLYLVISVADCLPVMLYDKSKSVIANIHSGWRGTAAGIITNTIEKMRAEFNTNPADIIAFGGQCIGKEKFEVGGEVAALFDEKYVKGPPRLTSGEPPLLIKEGKFYIDLKSVVKDQLLDAGVLGQNIEISPYCTFTEKDMFHSYRRDRDKSGRMFALIGMRQVR